MRKAHNAANQTSVGICKEFHFALLVAGGRMRYRGSSSNNPNLMYRDECDRRMRPGGGGKDGFGRDSRNSHDDDRPSSSSFRDRSRDQRNSYNSGSEQYQSYGCAGVGYNSHGGAGGQEQPGQFCQPSLPPPTASLQPLMAQQFAPQQPLMGFVGQAPYPFASPPPPPPPGLAPPGQ